MRQSGRRWKSLLGSFKSTGAARQQARKRRGMRKLFVEPLEDRRLLATLSQVGTTLTIDLDNTGEQVRIASGGSGTYYTLGSESAHSFVNDGTNPVNAAYVTGFGTTTATVTAAGLAAYDTIHVIDSAQNTRFKFDGAGGSTFSDNFAITMNADTAVGAGELAVGFDGTGTFHGIELNSTATVQTASGAITLTGKGGTSGAGVRIIGSSTVQSVDGAITIDGTGKADHGVEISGGSSVRSTGTGASAATITITGTGGTGVDKNGVMIDGAGTLITSVDGDISITGSAAGNFGVEISATAVVSSTGTAAITINGNGPSGVEVKNSGVTATSGAIAITGTATSATGVRLTGNGSISTTTGSITLTGTGGSSPSGAGIAVGGLFGDGTIQPTDGAGSVISTATGTGNVTVTGTAGGGTGQYGVALRNGGAVTSGSGTLLIDGLKSVPGGLSGDVQLNGPVTSSGADITIRADRDIVGDANGDISSGPVGGNIFITANQDAVGSPNDAGTIQTAGDVTAGTGNITLSLTDCDGNMTGNITSGNNLVKNGSGALRLSGGANTYSGTTTVNGGYLLVNGVLTQTTVSIYGSGGGTFGGTGTINATNGLTVYPGGILDPGDVSAGCAAQPGILTVNGNVTIQQGGTYRVQLNGLTPGTGYDQLRLNGGGNLTGDLGGNNGATLLMQTGGGLPVGAEFRIIDNDNTDLITTRFQGLPEGAFLTAGGVMMNISYLSGSNDNDVTLTAPGRFDFNGYNGYTADNYVGVSPFQQKTSGNSYGWQTLPPRYFERNYPVNPPYTTAEERLKFDGHSTDRVGSPLTFETTVVAGKAYNVCLLTGDTNWNHDKQQFQVWDGSTAEPPLTVDPTNPPAGTQIVDTWGAGAIEGGGSGITWGGGTANTGAGYYRWVCFTTPTIGDGLPADGEGTILMRMRDLGGVDTTAVILAMDIRPVETVGQITLSRTSPSGTPPLRSLPADGTTVDTYQGTGAPPGATITITVSAGSPVQYARVTPDGDTTAFGAQVTADASGLFTFSVKRPATLTNTSLTTENWTITTLASSGLSRGRVAQPYEAPQQAAPLRFDFGIYGSPVQTYGTPTKSFLEVIPQMLYSATRGYGWNVRVAGANRKDPGMSALRTDLNYARDATFKVDLPDGAYNVRIYHSNPKYYGTVSYTADNFNVYAEGALQYNVPNIPAGTTDIRTFNVTVSGGALELRFQDAGGLDGNFVVAGIDISAGALPTDQPLLAAGDPRDSGATAITLPLLQPVVAEATARWAATELTAEQVATLARVQYAVVDLGGAYLGLADSATNTIRIDDDGAMLGWSVVRGHSSLGRGRMTSDEGPMAVGGIDLLTVVMHELGHLLGHDHSAAGLMAPMLGAGLARAPATPDELLPDLSPFSAGRTAAGGQTRGQVAWQTGAAAWDFGTASWVSRRGGSVEDVFAQWGDDSASSADGSDAVSPLLQADDESLLAARMARTDEETARARVPRRRLTPRFERELDGWFAELAAEEP